MQGLVTSGIKEVLVDKEKNSIRIILVQDNNEFYIDLPSDNLAASLVLIIRAIDIAGVAGEVVAIKIVAANVDLDQAGDVLLTLENTVGAKMTFGMSIDMVTQLSALFDTALQSRSGSTRKH